VMDRKITMRTLKALEQELSDKINKLIKI
jgi:hypothetical protein